MFKSARKKLTLLYLLIIMIISILFSVFIYQIQGSEIDRLLNAQLRAIERREALIPGYTPQLTPEPELATEARNRLVFNLFITNVVVLIFAGGTGYYLSGKTLEPIEEMMDEQARFVADASHEIRTPITSIKTQTEVALRDKKLTLTEAKAILGSNLEELDNLSQLSEYLLNLANYERNEKPPFDRVSLPEIAKQSIEKIKPLADKKSIKIENSVSTIKVNGDKISLLKLFVIFLDNAIKYSPDKSSIKIVSKKSDNQVKITFEDTGYGIPKEDLQKIFNRFYRADQSRARSDVAGFGLGLSLADQIVKLHKGTLEVESEVGKGSKFIVSLPDEVK